jgi:hypothetical protein
MGASALLRWVMMVVGVLLVAAVPAAAQQSAGPDAAPTGSKAPRPDPAPVTSTPRPATVVRPAQRPVAAGATTARPPAPVSTTPARSAAGKPLQRATTHGQQPVHRRRSAHAAKRRRVALAALPRLSVARLSAPPAKSDAGRARKLAAGAVSLLVLALASATLLALTARVERRRVAR